MKKLIALILICSLTTGINAQTVRMDGTGNYIAIRKADKPLEAGKPTGKHYTDTKGISYQVLETSKGKLYYVRTSIKTGLQYKAYLKVESK